MDCYVADGYWVDGYTEQDVCSFIPVAPRGDDGGFAYGSGQARKEIYRRQIEEIEARLEEVAESEEPVAEQAKAIRRIATPFLEAAPSDPVAHFDAILDRFKAQDTSVSDAIAAVMTIIRAERRRKNNNLAIALLMADE